MPRRSPFPRGWAPARELSFAAANRLKTWASGSVHFWLSSVWLADGGPPGNASSGVGRSCAPISPARARVGRGGLDLESVP
jgi:hypothetical protein